MSHTFNEFQRELKKRNIPIEQAYMFTLVYERLSECENQLTMCAKLIEELANSMRGLVGLNEQLTGRLKELARGRQPDGIDVKSVAYDTED